IVLWLAAISIFLVLAQAALMASIIPAMARYLFVILQNTANGFSHPPVVDNKILLPFHHWQHYQFIFVSAGVFVATSWLAQRGWAVLADFLLVLALAVLPAFIGLLGVSNRLLIAVNPVSLVQFIFKFGPVYWLVLGATLLGAGLVKTLFEKDAVFGALFCSLYGVVVLFHWLGKIIYVKRQVFDYHPECSPEREAQEQADALDKKRHQILQTIHARIELDNVLSILLPYIETEDDRLAAHLWFHQELMHWERKKVALQHAEHYVKVLKVAGKTAKAEHLIEQMREVDSGFYHH
ncbi:MAG: hypothetical protein HRT35_16085, partial [Algicola sp.]|nr:hypothetical protein [Algicola sp.]